MQVCADVIFMRAKVKEKCKLTGLMGLSTTGQCSWMVIGII